MPSSLRKVLPRWRARLGSAMRPDPATIEDMRREGRLRYGWRRFRRATDRYRLLTDVVGGLLIVALVLGGIAAATGGVWPPVVIVESGSMMHPSADVAYGRVGTIDVGDAIFLRAIDGPEDVQTWADGGKDRYGRPGDVIAYAPAGDFGKTPVIHRAIAYIEVERGSNGLRTYKLHWTDGEIIPFGTAGIYFPPLGIEESYGFTPNDGFRPAYSGFVTKGDNAATNPSLDQILPTRETPLTPIIDPSWIIGEAYGEVPWMGLAKLALQSNQTNPEVPGWERVGNAFAPLELWSMFFLTLAIIVFVPLSIDTWRAYRDLKRKEETERRVEEELRRRNAQRKAELAELASGKRVTTFAAVVNPRAGPRPMATTRTTPSKAPATRRPPGADDRPQGPSGTRP